MTALAVMVALVGAMFAASVGAQTTPVVGDVSANTGWCKATAEAAGTIDTDEGGGTAVTVVTAVAEDDTPTNADLTCLSANANQKVKITPNRSTTPTLEFLNPDIVVSFSGEAKAGSSVTVRARVKDAKAEADYPYVSTSVTPTGAGSTVNIKTVAEAIVETAASEDIATLLIPPTSSGTIDVLITAGSAAAGYLFGQASITVGEAATPEADRKVATATLSLGNSSDEDPLTAKTDAVPEDNTAKAGGDIWLVLRITAGDGKPTPDANLTNVTFVAFDATTLELYDSDPTATQPADRTVASATATAGTGIVSHELVAPKHTIFAKVGRDTAGSVTVYARVNGDDGKPDSNSLVLTYTGSSTQIAVSDAPDRLAQTGAAVGGTDSITFDVTGTDKNGEVGDLAFTALNVRVLDTEGETADNLTAVTTQAQTAAGADDDTKVVVTVATAANPKKAEAGDYTIEVLLNGDAKTRQTAAFTVAGPADNVALTADPETSSTVGEIVDLTATVTDENGASVPDGTTVKFSSTQGGGAAIISAADATTKGGVAKASLGVSGDGTTFVYAVAGDARGTLTFESTAGADVAMEEVSLNCLTELSAFSVYTCEQVSSAAELFDLLVGLEASAIHLWNGSAWLRYSVVDGATVPGSTDFPVRQNQTLYISY